MAGKDEKRVRSKTISFYVTPEENNRFKRELKSQVCLRENILSSHCCIKRYVSP